MAKRKSRSATKKPPKKQVKLDTVFDCPFCNYPKSVGCVISLKYQMGSASCWMCEASYDTTVTNLTEPTDIYHEWIDECEKANNRDR